MSQTNGVATLSAKDNDFRIIWLEVGKKYKARNGIVVEITDHNSSPKYPSEEFIGISELGRFTYNKNGVHNFYEKPGDCVDLVEELPSTPSASTMMSVSPTGGLRDNRQKFPTSAIHYSVLEAFAEVTHKSSIPGGGKYPMWNYKKGLGMTGVVDSAVRHLMKYRNRINVGDCDPESGLHDLKHALWNVAILVEQLTTHPEMDDRFDPDAPTKEES